MTSRRNRRRYRSRGWGLSGKLLEDGLPLDAQPQAGDSEEMVLIRKLLRNQYSLARATGALTDRVETLTPADDPGNHISVRVQKLEERASQSSSFRIMLAAAAAGALFTGLVEIVRAALSG